MRSQRRQRMRSGKGKKKKKKKRLPLLHKTRICLLPQTPTCSSTPHELLPRTRDARGGRRTPAPPYRSLPSCSRISTAETEKWQTGWRGTGWGGRRRSSRWKVGGSAFARFSRKLLSMATLTRAASLRPHGCGRGPMTKTNREAPPPPHSSPFPHMRHTHKNAEQRLCLRAASSSSGKAVGLRLFQSFSVCFVTHVLPLHSGSFRGAVANDALLCHHARFPPASAALCKRMSSQAWDTCILTVSAFSFSPLSCYEDIEIPWTPSSPLSSHPHIPPLPSVTVGWERNGGRE